MIYAVLSTFCHQEEYHFFNDIHHIRTQFVGLKNNAGWAIQCQKYKLSGLFMVFMLTTTCYGPFCGETTWEWGFLLRKAFLFHEVIICFYWQWIPVHKCLLLYLANIKIGIIFVPYLNISLLVSCDPITVLLTQRSLNIMIDIWRRHFQLHFVGWVFICFLHGPWMITSWLQAIIWTNDDPNNGSSYASLSPQSV